MRTADPAIRSILSRLRGEGRQIEVALFSRFLVFLALALGGSQYASGEIINGLSTLSELSANPFTIAYSQIVSPGYSEPGGLPFVTISNPPSQQQGFFSVAGTLINLSGGEIDLDSEVLLTVYDGADVVKSMTVPLLADETFIFHLVPFSSQWTYTVSFIHKGIEFTSEPIKGYYYESAETAQTKVWVYDSTPDTSLLRGEGMHVSLSFTEEGFVHVVESVLIYNPSSMVIAPPENSTPVLWFPLDEEARGFTFLGDTEWNMIRVKPTGFGDWQPILPGAVHQVMFSYDLPYDGSMDIILPFPMPMESVMVMLEDADNRVVCSAPDSGTINADSTGMVELYNSVPDISSPSMVIHCSDRFKALPLLLVSASLTLVGVAAVIVIRTINGRKAGSLVQSVDHRRTQLLDAVIALDDKFKTGEITSEIYTRKRSELIRKLEGLK
jgi:hypothetical protein